MSRGAMRGQRGKKGVGGVKGQRGVGGGAGGNGGCGGFPPKTGGKEGVQGGLWGRGPPEFPPGGRVTPDTPPPPPHRRRHFVAPTPPCPREPPKTPGIAQNVGFFLPPADFPRKRKRSRWNQDSLEQKTVIPGMPTVIPPGLTREQERAYIGNQPRFGAKTPRLGPGRVARGRLTQTRGVWAQFGPQRGVLAPSVAALLPV